MSGDWTTCETHNMSGRHVTQRVYMYVCLCVFVRVPNLEVPQLFPECVCVCV